jgi:GNAT superfamily N-acetyltransferase
MSNDEPVVRRYVAADLEACRSLWVELTETHRRLYASPGIGGSKPGLQFDEHLARVGTDNLWVAEVAGQVIGLTGMIRGDDEAELEPLIVTEALRGRGIGTRLADAVLEAAREAGLDSLSVRPVARNAAALRFFHGRGFRALGYVELFMDLRPGPGPWRDGESLAARRFLV